MKLALSLLGLFLFALAPLRADDAQVEALKHADDARTAAMIAGDQAGLTAILSDELHYAHASGAVDTKASFIEKLTSGKLKYTGSEYETREFTFPRPDIALMTGKVHLTVSGTENIMSFLSVWREEQGHWRFLAWQSSKLNPAPAK